MRALDDILVLDLSRVLAGPFCTQMLADLGARVIKVERPGAGDDTRGWGPPFLTDPATGERGDAAYFLAANRGKRSITVDLAQPEGAGLIRRLAAKADVLVENYKVGGLKKYGLDYEALKEINPRLVYCSITGFGQTGPHAPKAGYDFMIQAMGGLMSVTGEKDSLPGGGPQKAGIAVADLSTGLHAVIAVLAALNQRHRSGRGQHIDMALLDVQVSMMSNQAMTWLAGGLVPGRAGNGHAAIVPYQAFPTADGHLIIAVGNDGQFAKLAEVLGRPDWAEDPRFVRNADRVGHRETLIPLIEAETRRISSGELLARLEARHIPCGPIYTMDQVFDDSQAEARELRREVPHALTGALPVVASPLRLSDSPVAYDRGPPLLGEHTQEVLGEFLGMSSAEVEELRRRTIL